MRLAAMSYHIVESVSVFTVRRQRSGWEAVLTNCTRFTSDGRAGRSERLMREGEVPRMVCWCSCPHARASGPKVAMNHVLDITEIR